MFKLNRIAFAASALAVISTPALAADYVEPAPLPIAELNGWYLRGDIGMTNQQVDDIDNVLFDDTFVVRDKNFEAGMSFGGGVGYVFNRWLRADVTGEYRGEAEFHGFDTWTDINGDPRFNDYTAKKSEWLALANVYVDLGSWHGISPFVGAGIGAANVKISSFRDSGIAYAVANDPSSAFPTQAYANDHDEWNFAWALYAGLGFQVTPATTIEFAYRYLDMGDAESGDIIAFDGTNNEDNPMQFEDITSHDLRLGVRYTFW
jgi:opacity protein-like surface antigen